MPFQCSQYGRRKALSLQPQQILVIRRDNIGDLVCTTPLLSALRQRYPRAWIGVLANSYNAPVLEGNADLDAVLWYRKLKHVSGGWREKWRALTQRLQMLWGLRQRRLDLVILAAGQADQRAQALAKWIAPARILAASAPRPDQHEVVRVFSVARVLGIAGPIPPLKLIAPAVASAAGDVRAAASAPTTAAGLVVAVHISARRVRQRWPVQRFSALIARLQQELGASVMLLWSPGAASDRLHPGDDDKAKYILEQLPESTLLQARPTHTLHALMTALSGCDVMICSDGGAMHVAAGLGKPVVCLFGDSPPDRWRPWAVPHRVLQATSRDVADIDVAQVLQALRSLLTR
jgi:heptosyltransferase-3